MAHASSLAASTRMTWCRGGLGSERTLQAHKDVWFVIAERDFPDLDAARIV
uniref:Uncharacterized protein n=1 Tax=Ralstonia solanacearum TaxID=305 RepID=A0A0S4X3I5_RALSL|nr:protein of unknown function [Ralstonia solanacearum]